MRVFKEPNTAFGFECPICKTGEIKEVVLIGIKGTEKGNNIQATQIHLSCLDPIFYKEQNVIIQFLK